MNVLVPLLNMITVYNAGNRDKEYFWSIKMIATLTIWLRSFIFLRNFEGFSWIISLTIQSIFDMGYFLLIFFIGVIAFADVFHSIFAKFDL